MLVPDAASRTGRFLAGIVGGHGRQAGHVRQAHRLGPAHHGHQDRVPWVRAANAASEPAMNRPRQRKLKGGPKPGMGLDWLLWSGREG